MPLIWGNITRTVSFCVLQKHCKHFGRLVFTRQVVVQVLGCQLQSKLGAFDSSTAGSADIGSSL